jgi:hypothetical protein
VFENGLTNYWPILNDLRDYIGSANMTPGTVSVNGTVGFGIDRFNNTDGAILLNNSYYTLPTRVYFSGDFTILAWVKLISYSSNSRLIDCGNGPSSDNKWQLFQMVSVESLL